MNQDLTIKRDIKSNRFDLPYADVIERLLISIFHALENLCQTTTNEEFKPELINKEFSWINNKKEQPRVNYPHLRLGPREGKAQGREYNESSATRISGLVINAFDAANAQSSSAMAAFLPSPLSILLNYLTVPTEIGTRAYAWVSLRSWLFETLRIWPKGLGSLPLGYKSFSVDEIERELTTIENNFRRRDNIPLTNKPVQLFLLHLLAMKGLLNLRFGTVNNEPQQSLEKALESRVQYCRDSELVKYCKEADLAKNKTYEFRVADSVERLPELAELANEIWGVPLPIRGADTLFFGGLRFTAESGLVTLVSGKPGTGKTSFALALAAALAPMGSRTFFITTEESTEDLRRRFHELTPRYLRRLWPSIYKQDEAFTPVRIEPKEFMPKGSGMNRMRDMIEKMTRASKLWANGDDMDNVVQAGLPLPCPLIIIFDGIKSLLPNYDHTSRHEVDSSYSLDMFVADCRRLRSLVVLSSAAELDALDSLDYLVDIVIRLEHRNTDSFEEKPARVFVLRKTRHQISRPGAHIFHLSRTDGFRISAQLPSQLDKRVPVKVELPDKNHVVDIIGRVFQEKDIVCIDHDKKDVFGLPDIMTSPNYLDVFRYSDVVVHGMGSSGKAGFGMKLLMAPIVNRTDRTIYIPPGRHRILVISFLYPLPYYEYLLDCINRLLGAEFPQLKEQKYARLAKMPASCLDVMHVYPGYLNPQDLVSKVIRRLDQAELEGEPFDGVLIDGIQNVFLQFPELERNTMIWPTIYDLLRRRALTVVTTHTTFRLEYSSGGEEMDLDLSMRQAKPLLHALVQAADFFLEIGIKTGNSSHMNATPTGQFEVRVRSAMYQARPTQSVCWHREKLVVYRDDRQLKLPFV